MTENVTYIPLPIPPDTAAVLGMLILIILASYVVFRALPSDAAKPKSLLQRFEDSWGLRIKDPLTGALFAGVLFAYVMIFVFALLISLRLLAQLVFGLDLDLPSATANPSETPAPSTLPFGLAALLAAILGAPFIIWRSQVAAKQAAIAEEALFNDKINAAASDLAARRQVTRVINEGESNETILTEWKDDLVTRAAAIDRLEGLAKERPDIAPRIARMLSMYVQELSREHPAKDRPANATVTKLKAWAESLSAVKRSDIERAVIALGQLQHYEQPPNTSFDPQSIDLRYCNLQGMSFRSHPTNLSGARLDGARLEGTEFFACKLIGSSLFGAAFDFSLLTASEFQGAFCAGASFRDADISRSRFDGALLDRIQFNSRTRTFGASFRGAQVGLLDKETEKLLLSQSDELFNVALNATTNARPNADHYYIESRELEKAWRNWAAKLEPPVKTAFDFIYRPTKASQQISHLL